MSDPLKELSCTFYCSSKMIELFSVAFFFSRNSNFVRESLKTFTSEIKAIH